MHALTYIADIAVAGKRRWGDSFIRPCRLWQPQKNSGYGPGSRQSLYTLQPSTLVAGWIYKSATGTGVVHRDICVSMYVVAQKH